MIIADSSLTLASQHLAVSRTQKKESLRMWTGPQRPDFEGNAGKVDTVALSGQQPAPSTPETSAAGSSNAAEDGYDSQLGLLQNLIQMVTGKKVSIAELRKLIVPRQGGGADPAAATGGQVLDQAALQATAGGGPAANPAARQAARAGYGIEYDASETRYEAEQTSFAASGVIRTADGKEISFSVGLALSREYLSRTTTSLRAGDAVTKDPLVLNFNGTAAELTDARFTFDIDADGTADQVAALGSGSGYLALDRNGDGTVNNGTELFGARSGNGFGELAAYDQNGDGWIDEQDAVYSQLRVWQGGESGLTTLKDAGVGAISLANEQTPFALKEDTNQLLGEIRATGIYVKENGTVGTVQQLDLAV